MRNLVLTIFFLPSMLLAQKEIYIPNEWQQPNGLDYSLDRSAQSGNFVIFWGPLAGNDPTQAPSEIAFDPQSVLSTAEELYRFYIDTIQFVDDDQGLLKQYKIILVMLHTWPNLEGWAFGGNYDGTVGAMWMHPHAASSGPTLAHEFAHTLQNYAWMLNPGHGFIDSSYVGFFWETHAEFMALQKYPSVALQFDMARWLNTCQFHWSSTRHHYQAFIFLQYIKELDGIEMINRMWNESNIGEHPLQTYMRLKGINQQALNDMFGDYAMRNVAWDYEIGDLLRERVSTLESKFVSHPTFIPEAVDTSRGWYRIPNHLAPQDYGYNIIELHPKEALDCERRMIHLRLEGQQLLFDSDAPGWRFGLVAIDQNGQTRYSPLYQNKAEIVFELEPDEVNLFLVVTGAPPGHHNYQWEIGFPRIYRYPYEFRVENAWPEGFQPGYRIVDNTIQGAPHSNGGGFVASTATVDATAYVGPKAQVLNQAQVTGNAQILDFAIVKDNAIIADSATISGKAIVGENAHVFGNAQIEDEAHIFGGCMIYGDAHIKGNTLIFFTTAYDKAILTDNTFCWGATLYGDIKLGGDAEFFSECSNGTYLQVEWAYDRNCDGMDYHPANRNITSQYLPAHIRMQYKLSCDTLIENMYVDSMAMICERDTFLFFDQILTASGYYDQVFQAANGADSVVTLDLYVEPLPNISWEDYLCEGETVVLYGHTFTKVGSYNVFIENNGCGMTLDVQLLPVELDTNVFIIGNTLYSSNDIDFLQWYDCQTGLPIPGETNNEFTPALSGSYRLEVTSIFEDCTGSSTCYEVLIVSTKPTPQPFSWHIQPNPAHDILHIVLNDQLPAGAFMEVFDMTGQRLFRKSFSKISPSETVHLDTWMPGSYVIKLTDISGSSSLKVFQKI